MAKGEGKLTAYEIQWSTKKQPKPPRPWQKAYQADFEIINPDNYLNYLL